MELGQPAVLRCLQLVAGWLVDPGGSPGYSGSQLVMIRSAMRSWPLGIRYFNVRPPDLRGRFWLAYHLSLAPALPRKEGRGGQASGSQTAGRGRCVVPGRRRVRVGWRAGERNADVWISSKLWLWLLYVSYI